MNNVLVSRMVHCSKRSPELLHVSFGPGDEVRETGKLVFVRRKGLLSDFGLGEVELGGLVSGERGRDDGENAVDFAEGGDEAHVERGCEEENADERCDDEREYPSLLHVYYIPHCCEAVIMRRETQSLSGRKPSSVCIFDSQLFLNLLG